jgi:TolA-binding protein
MLLTIRDVPDDLVEQAKSITGKGTGSQAFIAGIQLMIDQRKRIDWLDGEVRRLSELSRVQAQTIERARSAAMHLVEATGQGDLLAAEPPSRSRPAAASAASASKSPLPNESMDHFMARLGRLSL